ncbi:hypothetical protein BJ138DRAFT_1147525 [Hygrophoropsis aurantiaca]|uniref:Uncharacterized protein n=1 Tax=Hygrophoropsis aurantiaca TaxID=72124 RepID=A0ACB8AII7_9AGAM|nr:hypothetical protein BJ138DRAFT_1147525 [Hygrophoropsis aurantiaca]
MGLRLDNLVPPLLAACSIISVIFTITLSEVVRDLNFSDVSSRSWLIQSVPEVTVRADDAYTFEGDDIPERLPVNLKLVEMQVEESVHFTLDSDASHEWWSVSPPGTGGVRFGPDNRVLFVAMFHETHCLRLFRDGLLGHLDSEHMLHCLNYVRQWTLCHADLTLEPGDFTTRNFTQDRVGATHVCRDWDALYDEVSRNWVAWEAKGSGNHDTNTVSPSR